MTRGLLLLGPYFAGHKTVGAIDARVGRPQSAIVARNSVCRIFPDARILSAPLQSRRSKLFV
jgi:hypothetical protein